MIDLDTFRQIFFSLASSHGHIDRRLAILAYLAVVPPEMIPFRATAASCQLVVGVYYWHLPKMLTVYPVSRVNYSEIYGQFYSDWTTSNSLSQFCSQMFFNL